MGFGIGISVDLLDLSPEGRVGFGVWGWEVGRIGALHDSSGIFNWVLGFAFGIWVLLNEAEASTLFDDVLPHIPRVTIGKCCWEFD